MKTKSRVADDDDQDMFEDTDSPDPAGEIDEDEEEIEDEPVPVAKKAKAKARTVETADEDEAPVAKKKSKVSEEKKLAKAKAVDDEDDEERPKAKSKGKEVKTVKTASKSHRGTKRGSLLDKHGIPYSPDSLIGKAFKMGLKGTTVEKLKAFIEENKTKKKGGTWVYSFLRKGEGNGAKWRVSEEDGVFRISNVKKAA